MDAQVAYKNSVIYIEPICIFLYTLFFISLFEVHNVHIPYLSYVTAVSVVLILYYLDGDDKNVCICLI